MKSGDKGGWVSQLLASSGESRKGLETLFASLPVNETLGQELGGAGKEVSVEASTELHDIVVAEQSEAREKSKVLAYSAARKAILKADTALAEKVKEEEEN